MFKRYDMIGMFDSGIGGLTILKVLKELLPKEDYLYYHRLITTAWYHSIRHKFVG